MKRIAALKAIQTLNSKNIFRIALFAILFCLAVNSNTFSGESGIYLENGLFSLGRGFRNRCWTPLSAHVINKEDSARFVTIVFNATLRGKASKSVKYAKTVWLPAHCRRNIIFNVLLDLSEIDEMSSFVDKKTQMPEFKEEFLTYADGSKTLFKRIIPHNPLKLKLELYAGKAGGAKLSSYEMLTYPFFRDSLGVFVVEAQSQKLEVKPIRKVDNLEYVYGEVDADLDRQEKSAVVFGKRNFPEAKRLGEKIGLLRTVDISKLPRKWAAYQGLQVLVMASPRGKDGGLGLDHQQRASLLRWVRSGGRLILLPGTDPEAFQHPFFSKLLPVQILASRNIDQVSLLEKKFGGKNIFPEQKKYIFCEALPVATENLLTNENGNVVSAYRRVGRGRVWFSGINGDALKNWRQNQDYWRQMLVAEPDPIPGLNSALANMVPDLMRKIVGVPAPNRLLVVTVLTLYCLLGGTILLLLRFKGRAELGWPALLLLSLIAFGVIMWQTAKARAKTGFVQGEIGVSVLGNKNSVSSAHGFVSVYSPKKLKTEARFLNPDTLAAAYTAAVRAGDRQAFLSTLNVEEGKTFSFTGLTLNGGELFTCRSMTLVKYGKGLDFSFSLTSEGVKGKVVNRTDEVLEDCIVVANRLVLQIGVMQPGAEVDLQNCPVVSDGKLTSTDFVSGELSEVSVYIMNLVRRMPDFNRFAGFSRSRLYHWPVTFYGWLHKPQALVSFGKEKKPSQQALQLLALSLDKIGADKKIFKVPAGLCDIELLDYQARRVYGVPRFIPESRNNNLRQQKKRSLKKNRAGRSGAAARALKKAGAFKVAAQKSDSGLKFSPTGWLAVEGPAVFTLRFSLPAELEGFVPERIWLQQKIEVRDMQVEFSLEDWRLRPSRKRWVKLDFAGKQRVELKDFKRFTGQNGELPVIRVSVGSHGGMAGMSGLSGMAKWRVQNLDLELQGRMEEK